MQIDNEQDSEGQKSEESSQIQSLLSRQRRRLAYSTTAGSSYPTSSALIFDLCSCGRNVDGNGKFITHCSNLACRLRLTDVKAEHYERKVATLEAALEASEKKHEELEAKYSAAKGEIDEMVAALHSM